LQVQVDIEREPAESAEDFKQRLAVARTAAYQTFLALARATTGEEYAAAAAAFEELAVSQPVWHTYVTEQWLSVVERWSAFYRQNPHYNIDTNNFIEGWHSVLKDQYLGKSRGVRIDVLIFLLAEQIERDYHTRHIKARLSLIDRVLDTRERAAQSHALEIPLLAARDMVREEDGEIHVDSFTNEDAFYEVYFQLEDVQWVLTGCGCEYFVYHKTSCKHMFLVERLLGHRILAVRAYPVNQAPLHPPQAPAPADLEAQRRQVVRELQIALQRATTAVELIAAKPSLSAPNDWNSFLASLPAATNLYRNLERFERGARPGERQRR
jgi:hypothetical protein